MAEFVVDERALEACEDLLRDVLTSEFREVNSRADKEVDKFCHGLAVSVLEAAGGLVRTYVQEAAIEVTNLWLSKAAQPPGEYEKDLDGRIHLLVEALRKEGRSDCCVNILKDTVKLALSPEDVDSVGLTKRILEAAGGRLRTYVEEASIDVTNLFLSRAAHDPEAYERDLNAALDRLVEALRKEGLRGG